MLIGILGIIVSLALLITLAYRGMPVIVAAPIASLVALVFSGAPILASYTDVFMPALGNFIINFFPIFLLGAIFGLLMTATGYAESIARSATRVLGARSALLATVVTSALMTYGGISVFVVAFVMFPLARELFRMADIPKRLIPGTIALGIFTFTMTALPGSPQVQNLIPGQFFGTDGFAAPGIGSIGAVTILGLGLLWLEYRRRSLMGKGEHFGDSEDAMDRELAANVNTARTSERRSGPGAKLAAGTTVNGIDKGGQEPATGSTSTALLTPPNAIVPFLPLLLVFLVNFGCILYVFPAMNWDYLNDEQFETATFEGRAGTWAVMAGLVVAILFIIAMNLRHTAALKKGVYEGAKNAMFPIFSTASEVGYGAVVASVAAFAVIRDSVFNMGGDALVTSVVSTSITAGITGSSSGGMTIALNAFGEQLRTMAADQGISLEAMHRLTAMASGGLDSLPHSGAVVTLLIVCGMTHRQSYKDIFVVTLIIPIIVVVALVAMARVTGSF
jgi:H+/gluconate symporter-like permease